MRAWTLTAAAGFVAVLVGACAQSAAPPGTTRGDGTEGWERLPAPPLSGRTGAVVAGVGHSAYVIGGWEWLCPPGADCSFPDTPLLADGAAVNLATGEWRQIADAPYGVRTAEPAVIGSDLYLLTGCRDGPACDARGELLRYDTRADRWRELGQAPREIRSAHLLPFGDDMLALSQSDENGERADHLYDPPTDTWRQLLDDPLPGVYDRYAVVDGGRLLVFGSPLVGSEEGPAAKVAAAYDLATGRWARLPDAPSGGWQAWHIGDEVWLNPHFGPEGGAVLDLASERWRDFPQIPHPDAYDLAGIVGDGEAEYEYPAGWLRDTRSDGWLRIPDRPGDVYDESLTAVGEDLVVFGGQRWARGEGELVVETWVWRPPA